MTKVADLLSYERGQQDRSPWFSIYISVGVQFVVGMQISIYYMSMWPYLSGLDADVGVEFVGWVVAACSFGCALANPLFGWWNQYNMAVKSPVILGMIMAGLGQIFYAVLPLFPAHAKWLMIASRFITGIGTGTMTVLRSYVSMASFPEDRLRAISFGTAGFTLGVSFGPVLQAVFIPFDVDGFRLGALVLNMYTLPAMLMAFSSFAAAITMLTLFSETYPTLPNNKQESSSLEPFDVSAAMVCIYLWFVPNLVSTNIEVISTPLSTVMFNWVDRESVQWNALLQFSACIIGAAINFLIGYTRLGNIDIRRQILFGLTAFLLYHLVDYPWPFYEGPLDYISQGHTSVDEGGCSPSFLWCSDSVRVPKSLYIFSYIFFFGIGFPFICSPSSTLFSQVLGPRKQGSMQGLYSFGGSLAQLVGPILSTTLFEHSGYKYIMVMQILAILLGMISLLVFHRRLVPLQMKK